MSDKPSRNEDEYFVKQSAELVKKCGADLVTEDYHGIQVDRCPECTGMWLDAGEAEDLLRREDAGMIDIMRSIMKGVGSR
jgi:hypothetical protein